MDVDTNIKKFKFKYSKTVWVLLVVAMILTAIGAVWNIYNAVTLKSVGSFKKISYIIVAVICFAIFVTCLSMAVYGRYVVKDKYVYCRFGYVFTKYEIKDIVEIKLFSKTQKLVVYFKDLTFTVIVIDKSKYDEFISAVKEHGGRIEYSSKQD